MLHSFPFYYSLPFWLAFVLIALAFRAFAAKPKGRGIFLLIASSGMLLAMPGFTPVKLGLVLCLTAVSFAVAGRLVRSRASMPPGSRKGLMFLGVVMVLAFLAFFKYRFIQGFFLGRPAAAAGTASSLIFLIGVSYFSFKMIHVLIESSRGKIEGLTALNYVNYILYFVPFISGPINRFNPFSSQMSAPMRTGLKDDLKRGGERIVHGLFKKFVLVQLLYPHILGNQATPLAELAPGRILLGLYAFAFYFYFDFSGYTDLAIGAGRIMGLDLPENFNRPFLKKNIRELWMNWHMSLTGWLVEYVYWPLVRKLRGADFFRERPVLLSNIGMIVTFILCGMWHGETANFMIWGAYHGFGIAAVNIYQREKRKVRNPLLVNYFRSRTSQWVG
ncbi:MAG: MBOAT family O-acyltransferase, partial [Acidobacteriota bacterium]